MDQADVDITELDAHEQPSAQLRAIWKSHSKADQNSLLGSGVIHDLQSPEVLKQFSIAGEIQTEKLKAAFQHVDPELQMDDVANVPIYFHPLLPGS